MRSVARTSVLIVAGILFFYCGLSIICLRVRAVRGWTKWFPSVAVVLIANDGCRCVAFLPNSRHTLRHVSGVRFAWVGWIPALGSDILLCIPLHWWSKSNFSLGQASGFLCCVPKVKVFARPIVLRSSRVALSGASRDELQSFLRGPCRTCCVSMVHGVSLELSDAESFVGIGSRGPLCCPNK